jgi:hypothetical protein
LFSQIEWKIRNQISSSTTNSFPQESSSNVQQSEIIPSQFFKSVVKSISDE